MEISSNINTLKLNTRVVGLSVTLSPAAIELDSVGRPLRRGYVPVEQKIQQELQDLKPLKRQRKINRHNTLKASLDKLSATTTQICWVCLGSWEPHGSFWYICNQYDDDEAKTALDAQEKLRSSLARFWSLHGSLAADQSRSPAGCDAGNLVRLLVKEEQLTQARKRADELERENFDGSQCPRWARNCTILISKLKMNDMEISKAILLMDSNEQLALDMVKQLLKFTPSAEDEHSEDI
ncbi:hypothetical protein KR200_004996 [Drosophila serrata]|nr:hypothetical protein KR200_004996 [Drosophila serrata]